MVAKICPSFETDATVAYSPDAKTVVGPPAIEAYVVEW